MSLTEDQLWQIEQDVRRHGPECVEFYKARLAEGASPRFAAMLATQEFPGAAGTDRNFLEGRHNNQHMTERTREMMHARAKKAGVVTTGKIHVSGLGPPTDPRAWVSGLDDVAAVCKERNLTARGAVNIDGRPMQPTFKPLSDKIVNEHVQNRVAEDPSLAEKIKKRPSKINEIKEAVIEKHAPRHKR